MLKSRTSRFEIRHFLYLLMILTFKESSLILDFIDIKLYIKLH